MKKVKVAVCDTDQVYRERLAEYFIRRRGTQLQVYTFSLRRLLREQVTQGVIDIVLCGRGFETEAEKEDSLYIRMTEEERPAQEEPSIFKYQSGEEILRQMYGFYLKLEQESGYCGQKKEIVGVYSPTQSMLRTPFALTLAQVLAQEKRVLYLNLGEWAGFGPWFQMEYHRDLGDLLYLMSGYGGDTAGVLESVVYSFHQVDYVPPMRDAQLLAQAKPEEFQALLALLVEHTEYEVIFLDFGTMIPGFFQLLDRCSRVYGIAGQGPLARGRWQQFEDSIMRQGMEELAEKMQCVTFGLEDCRMLEEEEPAMQQWVNGSLGDRARAVWYAAYGTD